MFLKKIIILLLFLSFSLSVFGMDFSGGGMNFGGDEVKTTKKVKKNRRKHKKKKHHKTKKKKIVKKTPKVDSGMTFGSDDSTQKNNNEDSGMTFGSDDSTKKNDGNKSSDSGGMNFGDDDSAGMVFGDDETKEEGKIKQKGMNFDLPEDDAKKAKYTEKEDKIKITKKRNSYVIKGTYFKLASGTTYLLAPKLSNGISPDEKSLFGFNTHLAFGYDLNNLMSLELYGDFLFNQAQIRGASNILYSRDFNSRAIGLAFNFNILNKERANLHLNLHGGALFIDSSLNFNGIKIAAGGLVGFEYYLLLKHFSTSIFISTDYMTGFDTLAVSVSASLKYSF